MAEMPPAQRYTVQECASSFHPVNNSIQTVNFPLPPPPLSDPHVISCIPARNGPNHSPRNPPWPPIIAYCASSSISRMGKPHSDPILHLFSILRSPFPILHCPITLPTRPRHRHTSTFTPTEYPTRQRPGESPHHDPDVFALDRRGSILPFDHRLACCLKIQYWPKARARERERERKRERRPIRSI